VIANPPPRYCSNCGALESDLRQHLVWDRETDTIRHVAGVIVCGNLVEAK
jgi:hypothetical protein